MAFTAIYSRLTSIPPGLYLSLRFYRASQGEYVDETSALALDPNVALCVNLEAVVPPPRDVLLLAFRCFNGIPIIHVSYEKMRSIVDEWVNLLKDMNVPRENIHSHIFGLLLRVLVVNSSSSEVLYDVIDAIPVTIGDFIEPKAIQYTIRVKKGLHQVEYNKVILPYMSWGIKVYTIRADEVAAEQTTFVFLQGSQFMRCDFISEHLAYCYELVAEIRPENMTNILPSSYFMPVSNALYMKIPVLIVENVFMYSGVVGSSIVIGIHNARFGVRLTFSAGKITESILNNSLPDVPIELGGYTWSNINYTYSELLSLDPEQSAWAYIWARPITRFLKEYFCRFYTAEPMCEYRRDVVEAFITSILVSGTTIQGGSELGLPHSIIMQNFYNGTNATIPFIPETPLSDGDLDPGESIALERVFSYYDTCGSGFEVGISLAPLATAVCTALSLSPASPACTIAVAFTSAFHISLDHEPPEIYISGVLKNHGQLSGRGYNIYEIVYMRISRYKYKYGTCEFSVPAGIYFRLV